MLARLEVPYVDVAAAALTWSLDATPARALATLQFAGAGGWSVELRLLGSSHQALLRDPRGRGACVETVSCAHAGTAIPDAHSEERAGASYRFTSQVQTLRPRSFSAQVNKLVQLGLRDDALVGTFPGSDLAITALQGFTRDDGVGWRTWHAYPNTGEIVATETLVSGIDAA